MFSQTDLLHMSQFEILPVSSSDVRKETARDTTLASVYENTMKGWSTNPDPTLAVYIIAARLISQYTMVV